MSEANNTKLAVLGGTSLFESTLFQRLGETKVETSHGTVRVFVDASGTLIFIQRHYADASGDYRPPHLINNRAIFAALRELNVSRIIAVCSVGSLTKDLPVGSLVVPDDYFSLFSGPISFFDDARAHIIPTVDVTLREQIIAALTNANVTTTATVATYVNTSGPRFETPAEIRWLVRTRFGELIGMTAAAEITMARELSIPYAMLCMVDNLANGLEECPLSTEQFLANVKANLPSVESAVRAVLEKLCAKS